jgi:hypothetical protein
VTATLTPDVSRTLWSALEPFHAMVYFTPEPQEEYTALGLDGSKNPAHAYFPARAAAMGPVPWQVVQSTFFNFSAGVCRLGIEGAWDIASPEQVIEARYRGAHRALVRLCGDLLDDVGEALELATAAAAGCTVEGRPLYAGHASVEQPTDPVLALWHAVTLVREFRGDGHVAALVAQGQTGLEAAVLHVASGQSWSRRGLQATRGYGDEEWDAAVARLAARGWLAEDGSFTDEGRAARAEVEETTDRLALPAWEAVGAEGALRLAELVQPLSTAVLDNGGMPLLAKARDRARAAAQS